MAGVAFNIQNRREIESRREKESGVLAEETENETFGEQANAGIGESAEAVMNPDEAPSEISRTIELIGEAAYNEMTRRIDTIASRHADQMNVTVGLTCGPDTFDGAHELHRLLPGQPVKLVACRAEGVDTIDVYFNGVRIGRLALNEANDINSLLKHNKIAGAYVAEQNCFGKIGSHQMDLIIFYEPRNNEKKNFFANNSAIRVYKNRKEATQDICLN